MTGNIEISNRILNVKLLQQLGPNGRNALDHALHQGEEFALSNMVAMGWNMKKRNVKTQMIYVSNHFPILCQKTFNIVRCLKIQKL